MTTTAGHVAELAPVPDIITRLGIGCLVARARNRLRNTTGDAEEAFAADMRVHPIAENTTQANTQHYEIPAEFFERVLGPRRKYSSAYYDANATTLAEAEERALAETCEHAALADGQDILELGCGWGSLSVWMAERYPAARITAVSNSNSQRDAIQAMAKARGLANLTVVTCDMNEFEPTGYFDRVVSVAVSYTHLTLPTNREV